MLGQHSLQVNIVSVDYYGYERSALQTSYDAQRALFVQANKPDNEIWVFHGTKTQQAIESIMTGGFKVGGQNGHPVACGTAYGQGVYSATGPDTPMGYGSATKAVILAKALPGACRGAHQNGGGDSWKPKGDWCIFAKRDQVLPCFVIHFS